MSRYLYVVSLLLTACGAASDGGVGQQVDAAIGADASGADATDALSTADTDPAGGTKDGQTAADAATEDAAGAQVPDATEAADAGDTHADVTEDTAPQSDADTCLPTGDADTTCDGVDDDCDGATDEDYAVSDTTCGVGACASTGSLTCVAGAESDSCVMGEAAASDTTCDGVDDDCDGATD
ncbi:MAG: hypothetical protein QF464_20790, partial [Myxococcota bacterium]|nr:hypothetical protein [Myxococcota bacterium]